MPPSQSEKPVLGDLEKSGANAAERWIIFQGPHTLPEESHPVKLRIRSKFVGILVIASLLPLGVGMVAFQWFGERYYRKSQGIALETAASNLSLSLSQSLRHEIDSLDQWIGFAGVGQSARAMDEKEPADETEMKAAIDGIEARWPALPDFAPEIAARLGNDLARRLREFQKRNPNFAELLVTDAKGRLIAATHKTSDFWQADETWWQEAAKLGRGAAHVEGPNYDESAEVHSIDIAIPLFDPGQTGGVPVGVLKGVLNVSPLLKKTHPSPDGDIVVHEVVLESGEVLARPSDSNFVPLAERMAAPVVQRFHARQPGWTLDDVAGMGPAVIGFAPIRIVPAEKEDLRLLGLRPMWAVVCRPDAAVMAPVHGRIQIISLAGMGLLGVFVLLGYQIASRKIIEPISRLRRAAEAVSRTVKLDEAPPSGTTPRLASRESAMLLERVESIKTGDEIEDLAHEFAFMGQRILSYHEKLETEIEEKTQELRRDLDFAREFQTNLMPREYPEVTTLAQKPTLSLDFHHIYKPASTVGGDFFNVLKLGDSRAGIFIADVMGHGARSALVTAIVATLLQDAEGRTGDPAEVLRMLNRHFHKIVHNAGEVVFVSAFYLVLDVAARTATYASAGHPSPLLLDRAAGRVIELTPNLSNNPALGLFAESTYQIFKRPLKERDLFLLFTDGLFECANGDGDEFGRERLMRVVEENKDADLHTLANNMVRAARDFAGLEGLADDVCLVGVDVCEPAGIAARHQEEAAATPAK
jgi:serine phosphatase RsbU (regulator of sigma subunit)